MKLNETILSGVNVIEVDTLRDDRGEFSRIFCDEKLQEILNGRVIKQMNRSMTRKVGAIRGMHFQYAPYAEMKIVRCIRGKVFDVAVDLRLDSSTFLQWVGLELSPKSNNALVIPEGCAHGFQILEEDSELLYLHTTPYTPAAEGAIRFDDPLVAISWPLIPTEISQRDLLHPYLNNAFKGIVV